MAARDEASSRAREATTRATTAEVAAKRAVREKRTAVALVQAERQLALEARDAATARAEQAATRAAMADEVARRAEHDKEAAVKAAWLQAAGAERHASAAAPSAIVAW